MSHPEQNGTIEEYDDDDETKLVLPRVKGEKQEALNAILLQPDLTKEEVVKIAKKTELEKSVDSLFGNN